jgi:hypothetical protein
MKVEALQNTDALSIAISQHALAANLHLGEYFGVTQQLGDVVRYTRRMKLDTFPPVDPQDLFFKIHG